MRAPDRQKAVAMGLALGVSLLLAALPGRAEPVAVRSGEHPGMGRLVFDWSLPTGYRLEQLGATRHDHQQLRGFDFWVLRDPWQNEFCVLQTTFPDLLSQRPRWPDPA